MVNENTVKVEYSDLSDRPRTVKITVTDAEGKVAQPITVPANRGAAGAAELTKPLVFDEQRPEPEPTGILVGRSSSNNDHGPLTRCDVVRLYRFGEVDQQMTQAQPKVLFVSDERGVQTASALDTALKSLFSKHPDVTVYYMPDNEITAKQLTASQAQAHTDKLRQMRPVIDKYPNAYLGINLTAYGVRQGRHEILKPCAQYLDVIISSCYNPGREKSPPVWDSYSTYLDPILDVVKNWGVDRFGCGEFGNPVDPRDPNKRPTYAAGAVRYMAAGCRSRGLEFVGFAWWDNQKTDGPDNRLSNDNPRTAQALIDA